MNHKLYLPVFLFFLLTICSAAFSQEANPLLGAWELISGTYNLPDNPTTRSRPDKSFHFKLFSGKHFSTIMQGDDGQWNMAAAGTYVLNGNIYRETICCCYNQEAVGGTME